MLRDEVYRIGREALVNAFRHSGAKNIEVAVEYAFSRLRVLVRERIKDGDSDAQVLDFLVARYGEFVLLKPRLSWHTAALWGLPPAVLLVGAVVILMDLRRRRSGQAAAEQPNLTAAEEARLAELLRDRSAT